MATGKGTWKARNAGGKGKGAMPALGNGNASGPADAAIREISRQLSTPGNEGRVWVQDWGRRFEGSLGSLRDFLDAHPDKFVVAHGAGKKFTVALAGGAAPRAPWGSGAAKGGGKWVNAGGAWTNQGGSWTQPGGKGKWAGGGGPARAAIANSAGGGWDPVVAAAIREIREQLQQPGNEGSVWIKGWGARYQGTLGSLRAFLESRPDKFAVIPGEGRKYTVQLAAAGAAAPDTGKKRQGTWEKGPAAKRAKGQAGMQAIAPPKEETEEQLTEAAIAEVTKQLQKPGNKGNVWIRDWPRRFSKTLGTLREFLESQFEHFVVVEGEGKKFSVELVVT